MEKPDGGGRTRFVWPPRPTRRLTPPQEQRQREKRESCEVPPENTRALRDLFHKLENEKRESARAGSVSFDPVEEPKPDFSQPYKVTKPQPVARPFMLPPSVAGQKPQYYRVPSAPLGYKSPDSPAPPTTEAPPTPPSKPTGTPGSRPGSRANSAGRRARSGGRRSGGRRSGGLRSARSGGLRHSNGRLRWSDDAIVRGHKRSLSAPHQEATDHPFGGGPSKGELTLSGVRNLAKKYVDEGNPDERFKDFVCLFSGVRSSVYSAEDTVTNKLWAIKKADMTEFTDLKEPYSLDRLVRCIPLMRELKHDNLMQTGPTFLTNDCLWISMELGSETLENAVHSTDPTTSIPTEGMACIMREVLQALHYLRSRGILHRGVHSDAIFFVRDESRFRAVPGRPVPSLQAMCTHRIRRRFTDPELKLMLDAKTLAFVDQYHEYDVKLGIQGAFTLKSRRSKEAVGHANWMSPQQVSGSEYSYENDMWALGVALYEMIERSPPYDDKPTMEAKKLIAKKGAPPLKRPHIYPPELRDFLAKILAMKQKQRLTPEEALTHAFVRTANWGVLDRWLARNLDPLDDDDSVGDRSDYDSEDSYDIDDPPLLYRALYDYSAADDTELSFKEGDYFEVVKRSPTGWWRCVTEDGRRGSSPANYMAPVSNLYF